MLYLCIYKGTIRYESNELAAVRSWLSELYSEVIILCGRFNFDGDTVDLRDIIDELNKKYGYDTVKTGEVFPTNTAAVLVNNGGVVQPLPFIWGFPKWRGPGVIINARAETAREKPMFRRSLERRRCVVPSSGFYEWQQMEGKKKKDKYRFNYPGQDVLYMAGIWNTCTTADGSEYPAFAILTTAANESVSAIHDRMPVLLNKDEQTLWLTDNSFVDFALTRPGLELVHQPA